MTDSKNSLTFFNNVERLHNGRVLFDSIGVFEAACEHSPLFCKINLQSYYNFSKKHSPV